MYPDLHSVRPSRKYDETIEILGFRQVEHRLLARPSGNDTTARGIRFRHVSSRIETADGPAYLRKDHPPDILSRFYLIVMRAPERAARPLAKSAHSTQPVGLRVPVQAVRP